MEERRSFADGEEDEEEDEDDEEEDMSPQKLRTMIKEGIEVAIHIHHHHHDYNTACFLERQKYSQI